jgi:excisionase family DNA binding protein
MSALLSVQTVANDLSLSTETIRRMCKSGTLRATRVQNRWRIFPESVNELIAAGEPDPGVLDPHAPSGLGWWRSKAA